MRLTVVVVRYLSVFVLFLAGQAAIASQADATAISANIQARHLPWGTIVDPVFSPANQIVGYTRCGDSAIWTGHYLAAEAYRFAVTGSADAAANMKSAVAGIQSLVDVTGTGLLARCRFPVGSPFAASITGEENHNGIYTDADGKYQWVGNTSRDQYSGVFFGLAVAYDLSGDPNLRASIASLVTEMLDFLISHAWTVIMPNGSISTTFLIRPDQQLALLQIGNHLNSAKYSATYTQSTQNVLVESGSVLLPISLEVQDNSSYFKFNLDYINLFSLIRLETNSLRKLAWQPAYAVLRSSTASHQNAFFNMIDRALNGANGVRDTATLQYLNEWLQRPGRDFAVDLRGTLPSCGSPDEGCNPVPVQQRPNTDFLWQRDPFLLDGSGQGTTENAGIDYILPFWMARYYGMADGSSVVSAASGGAMAAPESIATFYGIGLATSSAQATSVPLPVSLGGVSVQVVDAAGVPRNAPLFYASGTQINFELPAGLATGRATVNVMQGGATAASTTVAINPVAPSLFTANASGSGPAAALVIQGQNAPQNTFTCSATGCVTNPITLSAATYLSLYGTGIRNRTSLAGVTATIGGVSVPVLFAGAQGEAGLDQVNLSLPSGLQGAGETDLVLTVDGIPANTVRINIH